MFLDIDKETTDRLSEANGILITLQNLTVLHRRFSKRNYIKVLSL